MTYLTRITTTERAIRARHRETVRQIHREPWVIGTPDTRAMRLAWARIWHTESVARENADRASCADDTSLHAAMTPKAGLGLHGVAGEAVVDRRAA